MQVLLAEAGIAVVWQFSDTIECTHRQGDQLYTFLSNTSDQDGWVELPGVYRDLLTNTVHPAGRLVMASFAVLVMIQQ